MLLILENQITVVPCWDASIQGMPFLRNIWFQTLYEIFVTWKHSILVEPDSATTKLPLSMILSFRSNESKCVEDKSFRDTKFMLLGIIRNLLAGHFSKLSNNWILIHYSLPAWVLSGKLLNNTILSYRIIKDCSSMHCWVFV